MIEPFGTGIVIDEANPVLLASSIQQMFVQNFNENCINNISNFKEMYSWDSLAEKIVELYEKIDANNIK